MASDTRYTLFFLPAGELIVHVLNVIGFVGIMPRVEAMKADGTRFAVQNTVTKEVVYDHGLWRCEWLVELRGRYGVETNEDGEPIILECGAWAWELAGERGWTCEAGHEHVRCEVRDREMWDYCEDEGDAKNVARAGKRPHDMQGRVWL